MGGGDEGDGEMWKGGGGGKGEGGGRERWWRKGPLCLLDLLTLRNP